MDVPYLKPCEVDMWDRGQRDGRWTQGRERQSGLGRQLVWISQQEGRKVLNVMERFPNQTRNWRNTRSWIEVEIAMCREAIAKCWQSEEAYESNSCSREWDRFTWKLRGCAVAWCRGKNHAHFPYITLAAHLYIIVRAPPLSFPLPSFQHPSWVTSSLCQPAELGLPKFGPQTSEPNLRFKFDSVLVQARRVEVRFRVWA
jgi:hypothetical protein